MEKKRGKERMGKEEGGRGRNRKKRGKGRERGKGKQIR